MTIGELSLQRRVEFHETDRAGLVHFSNYFRFLDTAVGEFFRALKLPGPLTRYWGGTQDDEMDWPYASASCDFKKPLQFDDLLEIHLWVKRIGTKSLTFGVSFRVSGEEVAAGQCVVVCSKGVQGQPRTIEIPAFIRERLCVPSWVPPAT
ncbi:MAG TPA: thioesterase family protein [Terriglobia bacterium]|nr:thioesterase family protein [Terriglobia bacterium]